MLPGQGEPRVAAELADLAAARVAQDAQAPVLPQPAGLDEPRMRRAARGQGDGEAQVFAAIAARAAPKTAFTCISPSSRRQAGEDNRGADRLPRAARADRVGAMEAAALAR